MKGTATIWTVVGAYVLAAAWAVTAYRHQINPDGISYLSIAQEYLSGEFRLAVNAYWSPLYSWLLIPFLLVGLTGQLAARLLAAVVGAATLAAIWRILNNLGVTIRSRGAICLVAIPMVVRFGVETTTPDLLSATILLLYLGVLTSPAFGEARSDGVVAGLLGSLAFLAKAYALWFFLIHFLASLLVQHALGGMTKRRAAATAAAGLVTFCLVGGAWSAVLSWKYGTLTTGSAGRYNHALNGPKSPGHPMHTQGFLPPPNPLAVSAWEDPTVLSVTDWNPLASRANFKHQVRLVLRNLEATLDVVQWFSILSPGILVAVLVLTGRTQPSQTRRSLWLLLLAVALYPTGYLLLHVERRFLSILAFLLLILGGFITGLVNRSQLPRLQRLAVTTALLLTFALPPALAVWRGRRADLEVTLTATRLASILPKGSRVGSDLAWHKTLYIAFLDGLTYYGTPKPEAAASEVLADLHRLRIDYFIVWGDPNRFPFLQRWPSLPEIGATSVKIFCVPRDGDKPTSSPGQPLIGLRGCPRL